MACTLDEAASELAKARKALYILRAQQATLMMQLKNVQDRLKGAEANVDAAISLVIGCTIVQQAQGKP